MVRVAPFFDSRCRLYAQPANGLILDTEHNKQPLALTVRLHENFCPKQYSSGLTNKNTKGSMSIAIHVGSISVKLRSCYNTFRFC